MSFKDELENQKGLEEQKRELQELIIMNAVQTTDKYLLARAEMYSNKNKRQLMKKRAMRGYQSRATGEGGQIPEENPPVSLQPEMGPSDIKSRSSSQHLEPIIPESDSDDKDLDEAAATDTDTARGQHLARQFEARDVQTPEPSGRANYPPVAKFSGYNARAPDNNYYMPSAMPRPQPRLPTGVCKYCHKVFSNPCELKDHLKNFCERHFYYTDNSYGNW